MTETIGQQLKKKRETRNLTIEKVVLATRMRAHLIEAMEADDFESFPSPVQARAFLRIYAEFLGLSLDMLIIKQKEGSVEATAPAQDASEEKIQVAVSEPPHSDDSKTIKPGIIIEEKLQRFLEKPKSLFTNFVQAVRDRLKKPSTPKIADSEETSFEPNDSSRGEKENMEVGENEDIGVDSEESLQPIPTAPSAVQLPKSQIIFMEIGQALRQRREALSMTLDEIERQTHVRKHYLEALEAGDYKHLPSSVQTRGMLNNYTHFVDLDTDAILLKFAEGLQAQRLERQPKPVEKIQEQGTKFPLKINLPPGIRRYLSMDVIFGVVLILTLLIFAVWGTSRIISLRSHAAILPTAPSISDILLTPLTTAGTAQSTPSISASDAIGPTLESTIMATSQGPINGAVQITIVALESAWLRVTVDGVVEFEGRVTPSMAYQYGGKTQIEVLTGNGAAIRILYNQSDLGQMGSFGQVVDRIYTASAIVNPTPTSTQTVTITPTPSNTSRPTPSVNPSRTPRISATPTP